MQHTQISFPSLEAYLGTENLDCFLEAEVGPDYSNTAILEALSSFDAALRRTQLSKPITPPKQISIDLWDRPPEQIRCKLASGAMLLKLDYDINIFFDAYQVGVTLPINKNTSFLLFFNSIEGPEYQSLNQNEWVLVSRLQQGTTFREAFADLPINELKLPLENWVQTGVLEAV